MSSDESVTAGPLGGIPATEPVYNAAQIDRKIATLQTVMSGITQDGWAALDDIVSGIDTFVTKDEFSKYARVDDSAGMFLHLASGLDEGTGVSGITYNKLGATAVLLDDLLFSGLSPNEIGSGLYEARRFISGIGSADLAIKHVEDTYYALGPGDSGLGLLGSGGVPSDRGMALSGMLDKWQAAGGGSGDASGGDTDPFLPPPNFWPGGTNPRSGATFCDMVTTCVSGSYVSSGELCQKVQECVEDMSISVECSGVAETLARLNAVISGLEVAVSGISGTISGMQADISGLPAKIISGIEPLLPDDVDPAPVVENAVRKMNAGLNAKKAQLVGDLKKTAGVLDSGVPGATPPADPDAGSVDDALDGGGESESVSDATEAIGDSTSSAAASSGAEAASEAAETLVDEATSVQQIPGFVP